MSEQNNEPKNIILNEEEKKLLLDHNYDGIEEFDYPLPSWWVATFYGGIIFAILYTFYYHVLDAKGVNETFKEEFAQVQTIRAEEAKKASNFNVEDYNVWVVANDGVKKGEQVYVDNCLACHKEKGIGDIGPNLTDSYWLNVKEVTPEALYGVINKGVEENGMPAWGEILSQDDMKAVLSYVLTLKGLNLPGKEPQGEKIE
jgi:cytochrome c oxidase cbb3-type subunit 3